MNKAFDFLDIQKQVLEAPSKQVLGFVIVNQALKLFPYKQAIFWTKNSGSIKIEGVSGNASIDEKGPYAIWLHKILKDHLKTSQNPQALKSDDITDNENERKWCSKNIAILHLYNTKNDIIGGVWLERDVKFKDTELSIFAELRPALETKLDLLSKEKNRNFFSTQKNSGYTKKIIWILLLILALFPVRLSITSPAEIVAKDKMVVSAPYDGIIEKMLITPGQTVAKNQIIAEMESEELSSQANETLRSLETAKSNLSRLKREAISDPEKKNEINVAEAEIQAKAIEYEYAKTLLERSSILSPRSGVAILSDINEFQNKPVLAGEALAEIASPDDIEILIRIPIDALIDFDKETPVDVYLNTAPLNSIKADIHIIGYQASPDADGLLTYKIRAKPQTNENLRIGWKGTAKIYGDWTILAYSILRRPIIALRRLGGL